MAQSSFQGFLSPRPNKGGTNTGDATATAADIALNKTAYAVGVKVTGTGVNAKNYANGIATSASTPISFTLDDATTTTSSYITVSGLNFPNGITEIFIMYGALTSPNLSNYNSHPIGLNGSTIYTTSGYLIKLTGNATVTNTGFQLPVATNSANYTWYAWGV